MSDGFVKLLATMTDPGDLSISNAARVSYGRSSEKFTAKDYERLEFMMLHKHGTPFEAPVFRFRVRCTIKEARDWFRYRFSSYNEHSTRFAPKIDDVYIPGPGMVRKGAAKQGSRPVVLDSETDGLTIAQVQRVFNRMHSQTEENYRELLELTQCQELASFAYNLAQMTEFQWVANARTVLNFLAQRMDGAALLELQHKAYLVHELVKPEIPNTLSLWEKYRRPDMFTDWLEGDPELPEDLQ